MKKKHWLLLSCLFVFSTILWSQTGEKKAMKSEAKAGGVEQALMDLEQKWAAASLTNDTASVSGFLSDDWTGTNPNGNVQTKTEMLNDMKKMTIKTSAVSDLKVRMLNANTAVVTGIWKGEGTNPKGENFSSTERWTDVFVKKNGKWMAVASQSTSVKQ